VLRNLIGPRPHIVEIVENVDETPGQRVAIATGEAGSAGAAFGRIIKTNSTAIQGRRKDFPPVCAHFWV